MFAIDEMRFGRLTVLIGAFIVLGGGCGCDDDKQSDLLDASKPFDPETPCITTFDELRPKLFYPCRSTLPGTEYAATYCSRYGDSWVYITAKRCIGGFEVEISNGLGGSRCFYDSESKP